MPHRLFIPKKKSRSAVLSLKSLFIANLLFLSLVLLRLVSLNYVDFKILGFATDIDVQSLLNDTNNERVKAGLTPLKLNEKLTKAAYKKAQDMFNDNYWAHIADDGATPWDFIVGWQKILLKVLVL